MVSRRLILFVVAGLLLLLLFVADLVVGNTDIPVADVWGALTGGACPDVTARIIIDIRLMKAVVAVAAGAALSVSGLQMQTLFRNPLAGPYVLGISSGASLGVALFILGAPLLGLTGSLASMGVAGAAWAGSAAVLLVIAAVAAMGFYTEPWQWWVSGIVFGLAGSFIFVMPAPILISNCILILYRILTYHFFS